MSNLLLSVIKEIVEKNGDTILSEPKRVSAFLADLAKYEPKPQKTTLIKCLEQGFAQILKDVSVQDREYCKQQLAQRLHDEEGLDLILCREAIELLSEVLFGEEQKREENQIKNLCKNCGKELQEEWRACPYCGAVFESSSIGSAISSGSGGAGYGIDSINPAPSKPSRKKTKKAKPAAETPSDNTVDITDRCKRCLLKDESIPAGCNYYNCLISEAAEYDCGMKGPNSQKEQKRRKRNHLILLHLLSIITTVFYSYFFWSNPFFPDDFAIFRIINVIFNIIAPFGAYGLTFFILELLIKKIRRKNAKRLP